MAEPIKQHDFIEIEYIGRVAEDGMIFDTNIESVAKENGLYREDMRYTPITICVGEGQIMKGIDEFLVGKLPEAEYNDITIDAEDGFGKKSMDKLQMVPFTHFKKQNLRPVVGLQVNIDESYGVVRSVNGGRVIVDFNHPLAGKDLIYDVKVGTKVTDPATQMKEYISRELNIKSDDITVTNPDTEPVIALPYELPEQVTQILATKFNEVFKKTPSFTKRTDDPSASSKE